MTWPADIRERIVEELRTKSLNRLCTSDEWPHRRTVEHWMRDDEEFAAECARAREEHAESVVDDIEDIENRVLADEIKPEAAKVVISSKQWRAEKLNSRKYGAKVDLNHGGTVSIEAIERTIVDPQDTTGSALAPKSGV